MTADRARRGWRSWGGPALLVAAVLAWFGPLILGDRALALRDVLCDFLPWREHAAAALADGHLPLWSHASRLGQPFFAHPQSAVLYPPHLLWNALPSVLALNVTLALHLVLLVLGAFGLARKLALGVAPAVVAAGGFGFSTYAAAQMEFLPAFETVAWGPLTALLAMRVIDRVPAGLRATAGGIAALAVAWGVQALAGHPQALFQNVVIVALLAAFRVPAAGWRSIAPRAAGALLVAGLLGAALAAPQLLVSWDHLAESTRVGAFDAGMSEASVHPRYFRGLLSPFVAGRPGYDGAWIDEDVYEFWAATCHVGLVPILLLLALPLAWRDRRRRRVALGFVAVSALGAVLAMGRHTFVYPLLAEHVPPFTFLRWPGKWLHLVAFALPFAGAAGLQALLSRPWSVSRGRIVAAAAAVLAVVALADAGRHATRVHPVVAGAQYHHAPRWLADAPTPATGRVHTTHSLAQVFLYGRGEREWMEWAHDAALGETRLPDGVERTWGFGQLIPRRQWDAWERLQAVDASQAERDRVADLLNVRLIIHGPPAGEDAVRRGRPTELRTLRRPATLPRAFLVDHVVVEPDDERAWALAMAPEFAPQLAAVVSADPVPAPVVWHGPPPRVSAVRHGPNRTEVDLPGGLPGVLVLLEPWDPRFRAEVDGTPTPVLRANGLMMAVAVPAGARRVEFVYGEPLLAVGFGIAAAAALAIAGLIAAARGTRI